MNNPVKPTIPPQVVIDESRKYEDIVLGSPKVPFSVRSAIQAAPADILQCLQSLGMDWAWIGVGSAPGGRAPGRCYRFKPGLKTEPEFADCNVEVRYGIRYVLLPAADGRPPCVDRLSAVHDRTDFVGVVYGDGVGLVVAPYSPARGTPVGVRLRKT